MQGGVYGEGVGDDWVGQLMLERCRVVGDVGEVRGQVAEVLQQPSKRGWLSEASISLGLLSLLLLQLQSGSISLPAVW